MGLTEDMELTARQRFYQQIGGFITDWRENREWSHRQRKPRGLITDWYRSRALLLQASYMLLTRSQIARQLDAEFGEEDLLTVQTDDAALRVVRDWQETLTVGELFDAYLAIGDAHGVAALESRLRCHL